MTYRRMAGASPSSDAARLIDQANRIERCALPRRKVVAVEEGSFGARLYRLTCGHYAGRNGLEVGKATGCGDCQIERAREILARAGGR